MRWDMFSGGSHFHENSGGRGESTGESPENTAG